MSRKRPRSPSPSPSTPPNPPISHSQPILDRASTFKAIYSPTLPASTLQTRPELKSATHRIAAWRVPSKQRTLPTSTSTSTSSNPSSHPTRPAKTLYETGHDDDGEAYAGGKLERLLGDLNVHGCVVVARWYGGVMLGPVRFRHIENCAREAIAGWRGQGGLEEGGRRKRVGGDGAGGGGKGDGDGDGDGDGEREEALRKILAQRDASITTLRDLLAEKTAELAALEKPSGGSQEKVLVEEGVSGHVDQASQVVRSPVKVIDYSAMDIMMLRRREKAGDATIAWILGQIDRVEEKGREREQREIEARREDTGGLEEPP